MNHGDTVLVASRHSITKHGAPFLRLQPMGGGLGLTSHSHLRPFVTFVLLRTGAVVVFFPLSKSNHH